MAKVIIEGAFLGSNLRTTERDGQKRTRLNIDMYQADAATPQVRISTDELDVQNELSEIPMGTIIRVLANTSGFNGNVYFSLVEILKDSNKNK